MADTTTKALLLAIALGLWLNIAGPFVMTQPVQAQAGLSLTESMRFDRLVKDVSSIASDASSMRNSLATLSREAIVR